MAAVAVPKQSKIRWEYAVIAIAGLLSVVFQGFEFPSNNNVFHVPIVLDAFGSAEGPHDAFHRSLTRFASGLWPALRLVTTEDDIWWVFFGVHLATRIAVLLLLWQLVCRIASGASRAGLAAVVALPFLPAVLDYSPLGHQELFVNYLTHSEVITAFILLAWWLQTNGRWVAAAAVLGIGFNFNAFIALWAAAVAWVAAMVAVRDVSNSERVRTTAKMAALFILTAAPTALWILRDLASPAAGAEAAYDFREFLLSYFPSHTFVHVQIPAALQVVVIAGVCLLLATRLRGASSPPAQRLWVGLAIGMLLILAAGAAMPYMTGSRLLLNSYPLRMDAYVYFATLILLCAGLANPAVLGAGAAALFLPALFSFVNGNLWLLLLCVAGALWSRSRDYKAWAILSAVTAGVLLIHAAIYGEALVIREIGARELQLAALIQGAVAGFSLRERRLLDPLLAALVVAVSVGLVGSVGAPLTVGACVYALATAFWTLRSPEASRGSAAVCWSLGVVVLALLAARSAQGWLPVALALGAAVAGRVAPAALAPIPWARWGPVLAPALFVALYSSLGLVRAVARGGLAQQETAEVRAFADAGRWIRSNTPPETELLIERKDVRNFDSEALHIYARRPVWFDWKVGAAAMWEPAFYGEWSKRRDEILGLRADVADWLAYAREQRIPYLVLHLDEIPAADVARLRFAFRNDHVGVLRVDDAQARQAGATP